MGFGTTAAAATMAMIKGNWAQFFLLIFSTQLGTRDRVQRPVGRIVNVCSS
jgi:hypothetical protein